VDCEKLDAMAIDLVYDELDARATEEAEQHLLGCTRCTALVERLRAGKRASESLTLESPSSLLESRILEAAARAKRPEPWLRRIGRGVSTAGAYAMRPQVAMAAVVVVMVGMSVVLLRGGGLTAKRTSVTEEGTPVTNVEQTKDEQAPAVVLEPGNAPAFAAPASSAAAAPNEQSIVSGEAADQSLAEKKLAPRKESEAQDGKDSLAKTDLGKLEADGDGNYYDKKPTDEGAKGGMAGGAAADLPKAKKNGEPAAPPMPAATTTATAGPAGNTATATTTQGASSPVFDDAMTAYTKGKYADAAKGFDAAAAAGTRTSTALLYAARSQRALGSCINAMPRFQRVLSDFPASAEVPWAALEGGECARAIGDVKTAKALFEKAKSYPATKARAEANLAAMATPAPKAKPAKPMINDSY
jgi:TolA-binding protein